MFRPHRLEPVARSTPAPVRQLGELRRDRAVPSRLRDDGVIRPEPLRTFLLVQIPLSGRALVRIRRDRGRSTRRRRRFRTRTPAST
ncbi:hypothetical protein HBB16_15785 [Pseudonocardia sp. MCCB 268]|nr:hypothetical protein [Pseudonocardia cytotoxica]